MNTKKIFGALLALAAACAMSVAAMACECSTPSKLETDDGSNIIADTAWFEEAETGTTEFTIDTAAEFAGLAKLVNEGTDSFADKTITLDACIDLDQIDWTPIGTKENAFLGTFDGGTHTISNLWGAANANGLFGYTSSGNRGDNTGKEAIIKNFTLDGAVITDNYQVHNGAGAVVGCGNMHTTVQNVTVTGEIIIVGQRSGGIIGYAYSGAKIDNCHVMANSEDSTIDALNWACGGIMGFAAPDSYTEITNCSVKNIAINAVNHYGAAGILGNGGPGKVENVSVENITCSVAYKKDAVYYISGGPTATGNVSITNAVAKVNGEVVEVTGEELDNAVINVAKIGDKGYPSIKKAIEATNDGDTVTILPGTYEGGFSVGGKNIILEGTLGANGEILTIIDGDNGNSNSYYRYAISMGVGTIKNLKIINAWKGIFTERTTGSLTIDNVEMVEIGYGVHIAEAKGAEDVVTIKNSNIDITWANSFAAGDYKIVVENNVFTSIDPYYPDYGTLAVNTNASNTTIKDNYFGESVKIYIDADAVPDTSNIVIGANYYVDGVENAFPVDEEGVTVPIYTEYATPEMNKDDIVFTSALKATLNGEYYPSIQSAIDAATAENNVIIVAPGTHSEALSVTKSVVLTGNPNYGADAALAADDEIVKPVINISDVTNGGVKYEAANITFDNLVFNVLADATGETWNVSALGYYYENVKDREGLTVTNCDFINNSDISMSAIAANLATYTITNNTFKNFETIVHSFVDHGALGTVVVSDNTFENVKNIVNAYWGAENTEATLTITNNTATDDSTAKIIVDDFGKTKATPVTAIPTATITDNDAKLTFHNLDSSNKVTGNTDITYMYRTEAIMRALDGKLPDGVVYVERYINTDGDEVRYETPVMFLVVDGYVKTEAESVELVFVPNTTYDAEALENSVWDLVLIASDAEIINRLNSADFTFELTTDEEADAMEYEIIATNDEVAINNVNNDENRYEFHYEDKDADVDTDTALRITLGTVKFTGYGAFTFTVDTTDVAENTNQAHATTFVDNIVDSYTVAAGTLTVNNAAENEDGDTDFGTIDSEIIVPTKALTINIDFPNSVSDNAVAYQQMKVTVSGGELEAPLTIDLGTDYVVSDLTVYDNKKDIAVTVSANNPYEIVITNLLEVNTAYNVEVSGVGYRTAKYTVTMTDNKTLNFWNNVKDNAVEVEEDKASSAKNVTFLAGDIVKDSTINIYDLSAVVSYFGEVDLTVAAEGYKYAKYDLNRDGKIDSKDVAYVLVSWGK